MFYLICQNAKFHCNNFFKLDEKRDALLKKIVQNHTSTY